MSGPGVLEPGPGARRPEIREDAELAPEREQRRLGPLDRRPVIERRIADGAEQDRVSRLRGGQRVVGQRRQARAKRGAADRLRREREGVTEDAGDAREHADGRGHDFRTDAVTRKQDDARVHTPNP